MCFTAACFHPQCEGAGLIVSLANSFIQGSILHTRNHKSENPSDNSTDN